MESDEQIALFQWAECSYGLYPELKLMYAIPNGGRRDKREAMSLKRQGVKPGVPDICLPVARHGFHGMYIEMKYGNNKTSRYQDEYLNELGKQDYFCIVAYGFEEARFYIKNYLTEKE